MLRALVEESEKDKRLNRVAVEAAKRRVDAAAAEVDKVCTEAVQACVAEVASRHDRIFAEADHLVRDAAARATATRQWTMATHVLHQAFQEFGHLETWLRAMEAELNGSLEELEKTEAALRLESRGTTS